jgi:hypothetical protein
MPSTTCPQLIPLYTAWKDGLAIMREARLRFQESGSEQDSQLFDEARDLARQARLDYRHAAYETMVKFRGWEICQVEALIVERMDQMLEKSDWSEASLSVRNGHIRLLTFSENQSTSIDRVVGLTTYLSKITWLYCSGTKLTQLPELPDSLTTLSCSGTKLTELPKLPDSLITLACANTKLPELPKLPDSLITLACANTKLTELPKLPDSLTYLDCSNTKLTKLPKLPDSLTNFDIRFTPAAQDPAIQARLEAFKQTHPNAVVLY